MLVSAVKVAYDLANPAADRPACIAEEIIVNAICIEADALMSEVGIDPDWVLQDLLLEDMDFEALFSKRMDGFEDDPAAQRASGMWVPSVAEWFAPFNSDRIVHPYAATERSDPIEYDLSHLVQTEDAYAMTDDASLVDDPAPISGLAAVSEIVELARRATSSDPLIWVPDPGDAEASYTALLPLAAAAPSGWLEWEPHKDAGVVRKDPVIVFEPHRHYPVGVDQPWVSTSVMGGVMMHVPLAAVVSYRPDKAIHERWSNMFSIDADDDED